MRRVAQAPAHYEVELRQPASGDGRTEAAWRAIRRVGPDGTMRPLRFATRQAAQAHTEHLRPKGKRIEAAQLRKQKRRRGCFCDGFDVARGSRRLRLAAELLE